MSAASTPPTSPTAPTPHPAVAYSELLPFVNLYQAALTGNWTAAERLLHSSPEAIRAKITKGSDTALHIAVGAKRTSFVKKLVEQMMPADLELKNDVGDTVLHLAARSGIKRIAEVIVDKNPNLPHIRESQNLTPLHVATLLGHKEMVWYLYPKTHPNLEDRDRVELLMAAIAADLHDVALDIIQKYPETTLARDEKKGETALHVMARKPSVFYFASPVLEFWAPILIHLENISNMLIRRTVHLAWWGGALSSLLVEDFRDRTLMHKQATKLVKLLWNMVLSENDSRINDLIRLPSHLLFTAAEFGNINFLTILLRTNPHLFWEVDEYNRSIFHIAVLYRHENVFRLIFEIGGLKETIASYLDPDNNTILHLAAKRAPDYRLNLDAGAALQYRRELHWFKAVENVVPLYKEMNNSEGKTPQVLFTEQHEQLKQQGEEWMKGTATSCMLVATLIATVMFEAFSALSGDTHFPSAAFYVFVISDALSVLSSATSVLCFLAILTSGYAEGDFLYVLPSRLGFGLITLLFSIVTMMIAFIASLTTVLGPALQSSKLIVAMVVGPICSISIQQQFSLLKDLLRSDLAISRISYGPTSKELLLEAAAQHYFPLGRFFSSNWTPKSNSPSLVPGVLP